MIRIVNKATGVVWEVEEGSTTYKRCLASPKQYEISKPIPDKPTKEDKKPEPPAK